MALLDFDSLVICNNDNSAESLRLTIDHFKALGIKKYIVTLPVDIVADSMYDIRYKYKSLKALLDTIKPRGCTFKVVYNTYIAPGVAYNPILSKLSFANTNRLFIQTPLFLNDSWFSPQINHFLYKRKLLPVFTCFERTLVSSDKEFSSKLYKIQKGAYCIDINYMTSFEGITRVKEMMRAGATILPSISTHCNKYVSATYRFERMSDRMGKILYLKYCKYINDCCKNIFDLF